MRTLIKSHPFVAWPLTLALACFGLHELFSWALDRDAGLARSEARAPGSSAQTATIRWTGSLYVPATALYQFSLEGDGHVRLLIDWVTAHECGGRDSGSAVADPCPPRTVWLPAGFHSIDVALDPRGQARDVPVSWAEVGRPFDRLDAAGVVSRPPRHPVLRGAAERTRAVLGMLASIGAAAGAWFLLGALIQGLSRRLAARLAPTAAARLRRGVAILLLGAVLAYAAVLRSEALSTTYGLVESPGWLRGLQERAAGVAAALRPARITYQPAPLYPHKDSPPTRYFSDAHTYLEFARQMTSFYAAHYREPVFPFATKVWLLVLDNQDVAVSFASASFSVLAVLAAYLLGASAFSRWVGLGAALAMAIEEHLITEGVTGGRDEAFMVAVAMFAWALVRWRRSPSARRAMLAGAIGGLACLVRITSVSFVVPGLACLIFLTDRPWKARLREAGLAALAAMLVAGPYVVNCWLTFGDPLYAINVHANVYRGAEGHASDPNATATGYVRDKLLRRPWQTMDEALWGLTATPFLNKWSGFDAWLPALGAGLSYAALFGLVLFVGGWPGRLLLVVLVGSLLPYAVTWRLGTDWRFTEHAYPFFLVASCMAIGRTATGLTPAALPRLRRWSLAPTRQLAVWLAVALGVGAGWWTATRVFPALVIRESLAAGEDVTVTVSGRDVALMGGGWSEPVTSASVTSRVAIGGEAEVLVPLPDVRDRGVTVRIDPFPSPLTESAQDLPVVDVFLNGSFVSRIELRWTPGRVGAYDLRLPRAAVRKGINRLRFVTVAAGRSSAERRPVVPGVSGGSMFALWYLRIRSTLP
jgi:4-amino-4-deoxy-L-arabinose transferase-like glycosyltransferase